VEVRHHERARDVLPRLDAFFDQHVRRWEATPHPSLFLEERHRTFYRDLTTALDGTGRLRFAELLLDGSPVASHHGFMLAGRFLYYKPTFELARARWSPGQVLLRRLIARAAEEGATEFDFGLGDEDYKRRYATRRRVLRTVGVYP
jgi:CelD/BcsL family acetyltransferase involved in cellulose biosynthesis